jgi:hypothetical protein
VTQLSAFGATRVDAAPGLFAVALIIVAARWASKAVGLLFDSVERGRLTLPGVYPDTAPPTRRLIVAGVWMSALAMAYPYVPGSGTDGVKGISVFIGVILSFGSTGVIQHLVRRADADVCPRRARGRLRADRRGGGHHPANRPARHEDSDTDWRGGHDSQRGGGVADMTNYSTGAGGSAICRPGHHQCDTPWRQVEALLLAAARRTTGLR